MKQVEERYISFEASKMAYRDIKPSCLWKSLRIWAIHKKQKAEMWLRISPYNQGSIRHLFIVVYRPLKQPQSMGCFFQIIGFPVSLGLYNISSFPSSGLCPLLKPGVSDPASNCWAFISCTCISGFIYSFFILCYFYFIVTFLYFWLLAVGLSGLVICKYPAATREVM